MKTEALRRKWSEAYGQRTGRNFSLYEVEAMRHRQGGQFSTEMGHMVRQRSGLFVREQTSDLEIVNNIVTNEGLDSVLDVYLNAATQITVWYLTLFVDNITPLATHTAAVPGTTEITVTEVAEAIRETYNANASSGQSIDNVAGPVAQYIADTSFTAWGAQLFGGGTSAFGNTAGTLWSSSLLGSSKSMVALDTIDITYTFTAADV